MSWSARSRSSTGPSTSGARPRRGCACARRRSAATGGRRSPIAGGAEPLCEVRRPRRHRLQLRRREPAGLVGLGEIRELEALDPHEVDARAKAPEAGLLTSPTAELPEQRAELELHETDLLLELATERLLVGFSFLAPAAGRDPPVAVLVAVAEEKDAAVVVHDGGANRLAFRQPALAPRELVEPAPPLVPRDRGV